MSVCAQPTGVMSVRPCTRAAARALTLMSSRRGCVRKRPAQQQGQSGVSFGPSVPHDRASTHMQRLRLRAASDGGVPAGAPWLLLLCSSSLLRASAGAPLPPWGCRPWPTQTHTGSWPRAAGGSSCRSKRRSVTTGRRREGGQVRGGEGRARTGGLAGRVTLCARVECAQS